MIVKGRCRGNGSQLARYLLHSSDNERAEFLASRGTAAPQDLRKSLLEMSLTSEISGKTNAGLYHVQISPRDYEGASMSLAQKLRAVEIMTEHLGLNGHKWVLVEHEKDGRNHLHLTYERYNHDTGRMWDDTKNYAKHSAAARQMELEFGHKLTQEKTNHLDKYAKAYILNIWDNTRDVAAFKKALSERAGFELVQGIDNRPFKIMDQSGKTHDLARQLKGVTQRDVAERLNPIRDNLRTETEAVKDHRSQAAKLEKAQQTQSDIKQEISEQIEEYKDNHRDNKTQKPEPAIVKQSDKTRDISESLDLAAKMWEAQKRKETHPEPKKQETPVWSYSFKIEQPPPPPRSSPPDLQSDKSREMSDSQDLAAAMLKRTRQPDVKQPTNENDPLARFRAKDEKDLLAKFKKEAENDPLAKFRSQKQEQTRPNERTRERGEDDLKY